MDAFRRYSNGEFFSRDSILLPDSLKYYTKVSKRPVYGGGGIMPDIFVPLDTTSITGYYRSVVRTGVLNRFILNYVDRNRELLTSGYPDFNSFRNGFVVNEDMFSDFAEYSATEGVIFNQEEFNISSELLGTQIKALIARDLWSMSEYFEIANVRDNAFLKAMEVISNNRLYKSVLTNN